MQQIQDLIGKEVNLDACNRVLRDYAQKQRAAAVGAVHVTCSDECEREQVESFQHWFADALLPELKFSARAPFRSANLGARYEWGALRIAEEHFAIASSADSFKVLLVKLNSHVAVLSSNGGHEFGKMSRYDAHSTCCGALGALLSGTRHPAMDEIRLAFAYDDVPRLDMLRDPAIVDPSQRAFLAAIVNARIQARSAIVDLQDYVPQTPTVTLVIPTVTINRPQRDTEFVVGVYRADSRRGTSEAEYLGLGDDPSGYRLITEHGYLRVEDTQLSQLREARDHRLLVAQQWHKRQVRAHAAELAEGARRIAEVATEGAAASSPHLAHETLKTLLWLAADVAPIPLTIMLFAKGLVGIHHLYRVHRMARGVGDSEDAREILAEVSEQVPKLTPSLATDAIDWIRRHFQG